MREFGALIIGFPVAMLLAWAYELTPDGVKRTKAATGETTYTSSSRLEVAIIAGLAIVIGMGVWQQMTKPETVHIGDKNPAAFQRLIKRHVIHSAAIYVAIAWGALEILITLQEKLGWPPMISTWATRLFVAGFPIAVILSWRRDVESRALRAAQ